MKGTGILIDDNYEMIIRPVLDNEGKIAGGLRIGNILYQNQALILSFYPGAVKNAPAVGVGIQDALLSHDFADWIRRIRQQMELDGQTIRSVTFSSTQPLSIDGEYSNS